MADIKISALPTGTYNSGDYIVVVDVTTNPYTSKKLPLSAIPSGGGGGGNFTSVTAIWTSTGSATKNAYTTSPTVNTEGITITLTAQSNPGALAAFTVTLNGTALTNTYTPTGTFPANFVILIPATDLTGNAAETASTVTVALSNSSFSLTANNLNNTQPGLFTTVLTASYVETSLPFYTSTATLSYSYTNSAAITSFGGVLTPTNTPLLPKNATSTSGSFSGVDAGGGSITGSATGNGTAGAGSRTVTLSGSFSAVAKYTPAFYQQTSSSTAPTWTTASSQTSGAAAGSTITYPAATANTQYNWIATTAVASKVFVVSTFGNAPIVAQVTTTTTISGTTFNVFGISDLVVGQSLQLYVSA